MSHKIRLGPIAIFLAVVAVVLSTMVVLTTATTRADRVMAERFASVTQQRYALEAQGERFLQQLNEQSAAGGIDLDVLGAEVSGSDITKVLEENGYRMTVTVSADASGGYTVKEWSADNPYQNIWKGE